MLPAKRNRDGHPALCAVIWFGIIVIKANLMLASKDKLRS